MGGGLEGWRGGRVGRRKAGEEEGCRDGGVERMKPGRDEASAQR
jgi:hypothetical protein